MIKRRLLKTELKDIWTKQRFSRKLCKLKQRLGCDTVLVTPRGGFRKAFPLVYIFDPTLPYNVNPGETSFYVKSIRGR